MIERIWHGWTAPEDADDYERLVRERILPETVDGIDGCRGARLLRRAGDDEVEFRTSIRFESLDAVTEFAGDDYQRAHVPPEAQDLLSRFEDRATHYEVREHRGD